MPENRQLVVYRGVEIEADLARLIRHMPSVDATRETLQRLQGVWDSLAMLSELSGIGVEMSGVRAAFAELTSTLVGQLGGQARHRVAVAQLANAQVTIDILVRNLFERTADIGFLATDDDLRRFAAEQDAERTALAPALKQRLLEYQRKYSVYDDIVLLAPDGRVLARLDDTVALDRTNDMALIDEALRTKAAYVEVYRAIDILPAHPMSLVYACRVTDAGGQRTIGVLCLSFRFEDETRHIFRKFVGADDWSVVALLDSTGRVIASGDPFQVPLGAEVAAPDDGRSHIVRFAGRHWLAVTCAAHAFQGYAGPGWRGHSMTPLEHAFGGSDGSGLSGDSPEAGAGHLDDATTHRLQDSRVLYPEAQREIARAARRIEADLARAVWNGNLALVGLAASASSSTQAPQPGAASNGAFARSLLREIGRTGAGMRKGFTDALAEMSASVAASTLAGARTRAALAIDIMDRSLYERANDCRWWALTTAFRSALDDCGGNGSGVAVDEAATLTAILQTIHGLYTVYANLALFDRQGRIVAVSRVDAAAAPGLGIDAEWARRTLTLTNPQGYCVSTFEPSPLYGGRPTYVYAAPVRGLAHASQVVGGVAIVFDAESQFHSMLRDTLPRNAQGEPLADAHGVFLDRDGRVISSSHGADAVGSVFDASGHLRAAAATGVQLVERDGRWWAMGAGHSTGYREFKGADDAYREEVTALVFEALTEAGEAHPVATPAPSTPPQRAPATRGGTGEHAPVDLATLRIGDQWHAVPGRDLVEAIGADGLLPLPHMPAHVRGSIMFNDAPIAVIDADRLLGRVGPALPLTDRQIVVLRPQGSTRLVGLLVDALGDNPQVSASQLHRLSEGAWQRGPNGITLIDSVVAPAPGAADRTLLTVLSAQGLMGLLGASPNASERVVDMPSIKRDSRMWSGEVVSIGS